MDTKKTSTLQGTEQRLRPLAFALFVGTSAVCAYLLGRTVSVASWPLWVALALPCLALIGSNLRFYQANGASIGMILPALFSLVPACALGVLSLPRGAVWWACLALLTFSGAVSCVSLWWFARFRSVYAHAPQVEADAVLIVLGGLVRDGRPVITLQLRMHEAAKLWRESPERVIIVTGGPTPDGTSTEAHTMQRWLANEEGVEAASILLEPEALNTRQNLEFSRRVIEQNGLVGRQVCVVSSNYHLYRAMWLARQAGLEAVPIPAPVPIKSRLQQWSREVLTVLFGGS